MLIFNNPRSNAGRLAGPAPEAVDASVVSRAPGGDAPGSAQGRPEWEHFAAGTLINGRYEVIGVVGQGGMGVVCRVRDSLRPERDVALKTVRCTSAMPSQVGLFKAEFRAMTKLRHPNVADVFDFEGVDGTADYFITMEYIDGRDLLQATREAEVDEIIEHTVSLCRALSYVHSRGVVHLDLKPENVLVDHDGRLKVLDFGLTGLSQLQDQPQLTGTPIYMAPELVDRHLVDHRADLYSLGIMLYELVCGTAPFTGRTTLQLLAQHQTQAIAFDGDGRRVPEWLRPIILKLCAKEPSERFQTANAVIEALSEMGGRSFAVETSTTRESYVLSARFVGRENELSTIQDFIDDRMQRNPGPKACLLVSGPGGIGKTRLLQESRHRVQLKGGLFIDASCHYGDHGSYGPWVKVVRSAVALARATGRIPRVARCGAQLVKIDPELTDQISYDHQDPLHSEPAERLRMMEQVTEFLTELADAYPFTLCLHDLHWAKGGTLDLLAYLVRRISLQDLNGRASGLALLVSTRDDEELGSVGAPLAELREQGQIELMTLGPLRGPEVVEVINSMFGLAQTPADFVERVVSEARGNPFFVQEIMRTLVDDGAIRVRDGQWTTIGEIGDFEVPGSIREVFLQRASFLSDPARRVLDHLALIARPTEVTVLQSALDLSTEQIHGLLSELTQRQLVVPAAVGAGVGFRVAHDRMRETFYDELGAQARKRAHRALASAIESVHSRVPSPRLLDLAEHHWGGDSGKAALECAIAAGRYAKASHAMGDAMVMFERGLELLPRYPELSELELEMIEALGDLYSSSGRDYDVAIEKYETVLERVKDTVSTARLHRKIGTVRFATGELMEANLHLWRAAHLLKGDEQSKYYRGGETAMVLLTAYAPTFFVRRLLSLLTALAKPYGNPSFQASASVEERRELCKVYAIISQLAGFT